jgi:uncharacterized protein YdeI (YjbR/CyaY-like superfamily)
MTTAKPRADLPIRAFASSDAFESWLRSEPRTSKGVWLKLAKSASGIATVSRQEAIDSALCHGWIDGQLDRFDNDYWLIRFTPRRPNGKWSQINRERALALIELGRMRPSGMKEIEQAKLDGRFDAAYSPQSKTEVPADLQTVLNRNPKAQQLFDLLDRHNRYAILYRVQTAKKPETRASRIENYVNMLLRGETIYPRKQTRRNGEDGPSTQRKNRTRSRRQQGTGTRRRRRARG